MLLHMRTTVILPDDLFRRAKAKAAREGRTLTSLVEEALRANLEPRATPRKRIKLKVDNGGGMLVDLDLSNNAAVRDFLDEGDHAFH